MDKYAMLKTAEVSGVLAAFVDSGVMPPMDTDDFDYLTEKVAEYLPDQYTVEDIAAVTDAVINDAYDGYDDSMDKTAEEVLYGDIAPVIGTAYMAKLAGDINDEEFEGFVNEYLSDYF